jgi:hypothetical protein
VNASGLPGIIAGSDYAYDCGAKKSLRFPISETKNQELFRLNPHLDRLWNGPYKTTQENRMFGTAHGGTHDLVTLPSSFKSCGLTTDDITWTPKATVGGKPGWLHLNIKPLVCSADCCKAVEEYRDGSIMASASEADYGMYEAVFSRGCPPHDTNTIKFN